MFFLKATKKAIRFVLLLLSVSSSQSAYEEKTNRQPQNTEELPKIHDNKHVQMEDSKTSRHSFIGANAVSISREMGGSTNHPLQFERKRAASGIVRTGGGEGGEVGLVQCLT